MTLPSPKRVNTKPRISEPRLEILEQEVVEIKTDLEECKDVKSRMDVLDERTQNLTNLAQRNGNAIFGTNGSPGILTRLKSVEDKLDQVSKDVKDFVGDVKKLGYGVLVLIIGVFIELLIQLILSHGSALAK